MTRKRDYRKEYDTYHAKPEQKKNRAARNNARARMEDKGLVRKGDGKEVDHKRSFKDGGSNGDKNLQVLTREQNRRKGA